MNVEHLKLLVEALPKYKEASPSNAMRTPDAKLQLCRYTIIGALADVYIRNTKLAFWEDKDKLPFCSKFYMKSLPVEPWTMDVPDEVLKWYGMTRETSNQLWVMSARGFTFQQIAGAIKKAIEKEKDGKT